MGPAKGAGGEQERLSRKAAWDQKTFTSRLRVGFFAALGKENKKPATKMIQYESRGEKIVNSQLASQLRFSSCQRDYALWGGKSAGFFSLWNSFFENWKNPHLAQLFQKFVLKKIRTWTVLGEKPFVMSEWVQLSLQARSWLHRLRPLPVVTALFSPCKTGSFSWKQKKKPKSKNFCGML